MELSEHVEGLRRELAAVTKVGGDQVAQAGALIADALESPVRLMLLDVLSSAADEISGKLGEAVVEVRLSAGRPSFAIVPALAEPTDGPAEEAQPEEESGTSRVTLRLPDGLKARTEAAAASEGLSLNAWLVRAASRALADPGGGEPPLRRGTRGPGQRITGYAVS